MKRGQMPAGEKSFAESAIPLILIAILLVFIAGKIGLVDLSGVPVVGSLFPKPVAKVMVLGRASPEMKALMQSEDFKMSGVYFQGDLSPEIILYSGALSSFDIIILQGEQKCGRLARRAITDFVKSGKKLIVIGDACTKVPDDSTMLGWGFAGLDEVMPVEYAGVIYHTRSPGETRAYPDGELKIVAADHPIFPSAQLNFRFSGVLNNVYPSSKVNFDILAIVTSYGGRSTAPSTLAVVESKGWTGGKTIYFAFDPATIPMREGGKSRNMFLNTLLYLRGQK